MKDFEPNSWSYRGRKLLTPLGELLAILGMLVAGFLILWFGLD